jgi:hypothetical protein
MCSYQDWEIRARGLLQEFTPKERVPGAGPGHRFRIGGKATPGT